MNVDPLHHRKEQGPMKQITNLFTKKHAPVITGIVLVMVVAVLVAIFHTTRHFWGGILTIAVIAVPMALMGMEEVVGAGARLRRVLILNVLLALVNLVYIFAGIADWKDSIALIAGVVSAFLLMTSLALLGFIGDKAPAPAEPDAPPPAADSK
jgi:hypothetical protein